MNTNYNDEEKTGPLPPQHLLYSNRTQRDALRELLYEKPEGGSGTKYGTIT